MTDPGTTRPTLGPHTVRDGVVSVVPPARILVVTGEPLSGRLAGPAIRAWEMSVALSTTHPVRLVSTNGVEKIVTSGLSSSVQTSALVAFTLIATSTIILPLIIFLVRPAWARRVLGGFRDWLMKHNRVILIAVFGIMGLLFTVQGISGVLS